MSADNSDTPSASHLGRQLEHGLAHHRAGRLADAEAVYGEILSADPEHPGALHYLGVVRLQSGDADGARELIERAVALDPADADALNNLGQAHEGLGRTDDAVRAYRRAVALAPGFVAALVNLGAALAGQGAAEEAASCLGRALEHAPDDPEILCNLGNVYGQLGRFDDADDVLARALAAEPGLAAAHYNMGVVMKARDRLDDAVACYRRAVALDPDSLMAWINLGGVLVDLGRLDDAEDVYRRALGVRPDHAEAHYNLSLVLLLQGRFADGWAEYDWRWRIKDDAKMRTLPAPRWQGEDVAGKTVVVWAEQGVGDEVMFGSMIPDLIDAGARVVLECDARLVPLFERSFAGVECVAKANPPAAIAGRGDIDFQTAAGNLARWLRPARDRFPRRPPYLVADPARVAALREKYRTRGPGQLLGIAWASKSDKIGREKSMTLMDLAPLAEIPGLALIDLQYGDTGAERAAFERATGRAVHHDADIDQMADLDGFAAQIAALDVVVSISNTTVHMAGALGVPALVMLNTVPLSCWGIAGGESHWYPSLRVFRQSRYMAWADVVARVRTALAALTADPAAGG